MITIENEDGDVIEVISAADHAASIFEGRGETNYIGVTKVISVRLPALLLAELQSLAHKSGKTRNSTISTLLGVGVEEVKARLTQKLLSSWQTSLLNIWTISFRRTSNADPQRHTPRGHDPSGPHRQKKNRRGLQASRRAQVETLDARGLVQMSTITVPELGNYPAKVGETVNLPVRAWAAGAVVNFMFENVQGAA